MNCNEHEYSNLSVLTSRHGGADHVAGFVIEQYDHRHNPAAVGGVLWNFCTVADDRSEAA